MKIKITNKDSVPEFIKVFFTKSGVEIKEHQENGKQVYEINPKKERNYGYNQRSSLKHV